MSATYEPKPAKRPLALVPEPTNVTKHEWRPTYLAAIELGERALGSREAAFEIVHDTYIVMCTKKPWDPTKYTLRQHFLHLVALACKDLKRRRGRANADEEENALDAYYEDLVTQASTATSPEAQMLAREHHERRERWLSLKREQLRKLQRCVAHNRAAVRLLEYWAEHGGSTPLTEAAEIIGETIDALYTAKKLIERHAQRIIVEKGDDQ